MRKTIKLILIVFGLVVLSVSSFAQITASANATATIVTPIGLAKVDDMNFGNLAVTSTAGWVVLDPDATQTRHAFNGVTLPVNIGTVQAAYFTVSGTPGYTFAITLPASCTITRLTGTETMLVDDFTSTPTPTGVLSGGGTSDLYVGATVHVDIITNNPSGTYVSGTAFDVTVNYN